MLPVFCPTGLTDCKKKREKLFFLYDSARKFGFCRQCYQYQWLTDYNKTLILCPFI